MSKSTKQDVCKLKRLLEYVNGTLDMDDIVGADDLGRMRTCLGRCGLRGTPRHEKPNSLKRIPFKNGITSTNSCHRECNSLNEGDREMKETTRPQECVSAILQYVAEVNVLIPYQCHFVQNCYSCSGNTVASIRKEHGETKKASGKRTTPLRIRKEHGETKASGKRTTPGIPTWSPTVVLTGPDDA